MEEKKDTQKQASKPFEEHAVELDFATAAMVRALYKIPVGKHFTKSEYDAMVKGATTLEII